MKIQTDIAIKNPSSQSSSIKTNSGIFIIISTTK